MVEAVEAFGIPFMEANTKLETIIDHLEHHRYIDRDSAAYRLPIAYRIAGRSALAIDFVNNYLAEIGSRTDEAAHRYRTFAAHFMQQAVF